MKLTYFQLEPHLTQKLAPIYLISGDELVLKQEAFHLLRSAAKQKGFTERMRLVPDAPQWDQLYTTLYSGSLLANKQLIELDFCDTAPNKTVSLILNDYGKKPAPDTVLLIGMSKIDAKLARSEWYQSLEKAGVIVTIWPLSPDQLLQWIVKRALRYQLKMQSDATQLLADFVQGNLVAAVQAIEKLYLLRLEEPVNQAHIRSVLTDESRFTVFDLVDALLSGDKTNALRILETLQGEGTEPTLILWGISREIRLMALWAMQVQQGENIGRLMQKERVFSKRQAGIRRFLSKATPEDCLKVIQGAGEVDKIVKGAVPGNVWDALQLLCLKML